MKRRKRGSRRPAKRVELNMKDLFEIVELSRERLLNAEQQEKLRLALRTLSKLAGLDDGFLNSEKSRDILDTKDGAEDSEKSPHEERPEDDEPSSSQSTDGRTARRSPSALGMAACPRTPTPTRTRSTCRIPR